MNILCVEQFTNWGGGQRSLIDLLPAFSARGWRACVAVPGDGPFPQDVRKRGYDTIDFDSFAYTSGRKPPGEFRQYVREFPQLARVLDRTREARKIDLFYVNGARFLPPTAWVAARAGVPLLFHCHCQLVQRSAILAAGASLRFCGAHVIGCCRHAVKPLRRHVSADRLQIVYNGVGTPGDEGGKIRQHRPIRRIGVLGRIEPEKGQLEFVLAAKLIQPLFPECRFIVVGSPMFSSAAYYHRVLEASRGTSIQFLGWQDDVSDLLASLDILVVPSSPLEATTRVILEAYAAQVPVVAYRAGGIPEVLKDGETGFLARDHTPECLAQRILSVLRMFPDEVRHVVARARRAWELHYTLDVYRELVCRVMARAAGRPSLVN